MKRLHRPKPNSHKIAGHPLAKKVLDDLRPWLESKASETNAESAQLSGCVGYADNVFGHTAAIQSAIENLERSQYFIESFPQPRRNVKRGVRQHDWIEYHYSHYLITLVSLLDISLRLTNVVFCLGNRERDCKFELVTKNSWVARTPVAGALGEIKKLIYSHKEGRNNFVHCGQIPKIASMMKSEYLNNLDRFSFIEMCGEPVVDKKTLELAYKGQVKKISAKLKNETDSIFDAVWKLFNKLEPIYERNANTLKALPEAKGSLI
ncbi:MAG: Cthe_2314 family HEPN domain-containing protein [Verrucomicrobiae bacterium]|nr:Cthe_2314 family HEPN domain-containing protein [Verrucomicrobiae bacterium]